MGSIKNLAGERIVSPSVHRPSAIGSDARLIPRLRREGGLLTTKRIYLFANEWHLPDRPES